MEIQLPRDDSIDLCIRSLDMIKSCRVVEEDPSVGKIVARTGLNWKTWGDTISFDINIKGQKCSGIRVSSRPTARTTIVDFGKNLQNRNIITSYQKEYGARENE